METTVENIIARKDDMLAHGLSEEDYNQAIEAMTEWGWVDPMEVEEPILDEESRPIT